MAANMDRLKAIEDAMVILKKSRVATYQTNMGAWKFLIRVGEYLEEESTKTFKSEFSEGL